MQSELAGNVSALRGPTSKSLKERIEETGGRSTGFDYIRILLAVFVIVWHSFGISYGASYTYHVLGGWLRSPISSILPLFFALSGFLVAGSLDRSRGMITFLGLRVLRIMPALAVEVFLSALVLGPLLTILPLNDYFGSADFRIYFMNILGIIHYQLPGVFVNNPIPNTVNGQLWTVPYELKCYAALSLLAILTIVQRRRLFLIFILSSCVCLTIWKIYWPSHVINDHPGVVPGSALVIAFLAAVSIYSYRDLVPWNRRLFFASSGLMFLTLGVRELDFLSALLASYVIVYLGLTNPPRTFILRGGDYSYGLFLYGFVIQQAVASVGPAAHHWYVNLPVTLIGATIFAAFSWNIVEKPALRLRKYLPALQQFGDRTRDLLLRRANPKIG